MIDAPHLKTHRTAPKLLKKVILPVVLDTEGGQNSKLYTVCNQDGKLMCVLLFKGNMSDYKGIPLLSPVMHDTQKRTADSKYIADQLRQAFFDRTINACIPPRRDRTTEISFDTQSYPLCHKSKKLSANSKTSGA